MKHELLYKVLKHSAKERDKKCKQIYTALRHIQNNLSSETKWGDIFQDNNIRTQWKNRYTIISITFYNKSIKEKY